MEKGFDGGCLIRHLAHMHDRVFDLQRVVNFRDFGGYETAEGGCVKRGVLFRSAHFAEASDTDVSRLNGLGVGVVVDLRRPEERAREPNRWPGESGRTVSNDEGSAEGLPPHLMALMQADITAESVAGYMFNTYRDFPFDPRHVDLYRRWFSELSTIDGAVVIHCAAGKDRTGLGCALTLHVLGVGEEAIFADYEFTNAVLDLDSRMPRIIERMEERLGRTFDPEAVRPMLGVNPDYLRAALDVIETRSGSIDSYLENVLGVGPAERSALREKLTD
jgi:protein tyrosine/serine phosphatase